VAGPVAYGRAAVDLASGPLMLLTRRSWAHGESRPTNPIGPASLVFSYLGRVSVCNGFNVSIQYLP